MRKVSEGEVYVVELGLGMGVEAVELGRVAQALDEQELRRLTGHGLEDLVEPTDEWEAMWQEVVPQGWASVGTGMES